MAGDSTSEHQRRHVVCNWRYELCILGSFEYDELVHVCCRDLPFSTDLCVRFEDEDGKAENQGFEFTSIMRFLVNILLVHKYHVNQSDH